MYKKQLKLQKLICIAAIIACAIIFVYALGIMTDLYDAMYSTMMNPNDLSETDVPGSRIYYYMQDFNQDLLKYSIVLILLGCLLFITQTHSRRKYYIGNYVAIGLYSAANIAMAIWAHTWIEAYKSFFVTQVDFEALRKHADMWKTAYVDSTFWFDIHYAVFAISLIITGLLIANMIWKICLMKEEQKLIEAGKEVAA
ncbi:MAG: hypothetical protein IKF49_03385 [Clostridia bacterium]|nr:hypothetical protein [Clostridia bacterium]